MREDFSWLNKHRDIIEFLSINGGEARFVGGVVRNTILGMPLDDFDIAVTHKPETVTDLLMQRGVYVIPTGIKQGTVTAIYNGNEYQITTLRKDVITDGRWAVVDFDASWKEDAQRRDFTMNAMYIDINGNVYDYFDGLADLNKKLVRFIGNPYDRITEDYLRILRFFRINAYYGSIPFNPDCLQMCIKLKDNLINISKERITKEILKMLQAKNPWDSVICMFHNGFIESMDSLFYNLINIEHMLGDKYVINKLIRLASFGKDYYKTLRLSKAEQKYIYNILHLEMPISHIIHKYSKDTALGYILINASRDHNKNIDSLVEQIDYINNYEMIEFPLRGSDIMPYGIYDRDIGIILDKIKDWWISTGCMYTKEECLKYMKNFL